MGQYILRRALQAILLAIGASTLTFILLHAVPGDPVRTILGEFATEEQVAALRHQVGLDRPIPEQYLIWLSNALRGDLGNSIALNLPVSELIIDRLPRTAELVALAIVFALSIGIPIGVLSALDRGGRVDVGLTGVALLFLSVPSYVIGTLLVIVLGIQLRWLPASAMSPSRRIRSAT